MATPPAQPVQETTTSTAVTATVDSLKDDNIEDILIRLPTPASLARAALSSRRWRRVASSPDFLRRLRERHPTPPVLGLFVAQADLGQLPVFHPSPSVRADPDLAAAARGGDFLLTRLQHDPAWRLRDCRHGRLLLCGGDDSLSVYDPVTHRQVPVRRPCPVPGTEYMADCLLGNHIGEPFRVVSVQRDGTRLRAMEHRSGTPDWRCHPWVDGVDVATLRTPPMPAAAAGLLFWRHDQSSSLVLDTRTMAFSTVPLPAPLVVVQPVRPRPIYAVGDTEAGACCLVVIVGRTTLQVWLLRNNAWELERQGQLGDLIGMNRRLRVHMVAAGLAVVCSTHSKYTHFVIDLKDLSLKDKFFCPRATAYPFQMPWPPAGLVATYACADAKKQQEAPSSSRKRKSKDEMSSGKETTGPGIFIASLENEPSEKKNCYEIGGSS